MYGAPVWAYNVTPDISIATASEMIVVLFIIVRR